MDDVYPKILKFIKIKIFMDNIYPFYKILKRFLDIKVIFFAICLAPSRLGKNYTLLA